jgi:hypothetical protein
VSEVLLDWGVETGYDYTCYRCIEKEEAKERREEKKEELMRAHEAEVAAEENRVADERITEWEGNERATWEAEQKAKYEANWEQKRDRLLAEKKKELRDPTRYDEY